MDYIVLPRNRWYRGRYNADGGSWNNGSMLLTPQNQQCCLGVACSYYGVDDKDIRGVSALEELHDNQLPKKLHQLLKYVVNVDELYETNDFIRIEGKLVSDQERVDYLNLLLEAANFQEFRFVLGPEINYNGKN